MIYKEISISTINPKTHPHLKDVVQIWRTRKYFIFLDYPKQYTHLRIYRHDKKPIHNFMDLQQIKSDILGKNTIAIEIYPKESDFCNGSNTYHLWTWKEIKVLNLTKFYKYIS